MSQIYPKKLKLNKGDCIGILSCAGAIDDYKKIESAKSYFERMGFAVKLSETCKSKTKGYLCASDEDRANALNSFFADDSIDAIIAARGGYGCLRILDKIDYELIKKHPKIFIGYSDVTALSLMIFKKCGLVTYSAPMAVSDFSGDVDLYTEKSFKRLFLDELPLKEIFLDNPKIYNSGMADGLFWGGNLSTIQSLCGLDFIPEEKFVLCIEDVNEPVYKIDKMITQLLNINLFKQNLTGIVLGDFSGIDKNLFDMYFSSLAQDLKIPIVSGLKFAHEIQKLSFPIGVYCVLDTNDGKIYFK